MTELLKQGQYQPLPVEKQVLILFAVTNGFADALPIDVAGALRARAVRVRRRAATRSCGTRSRPRAPTSKAWNDLTAPMKAVLAEFGKEFAPDAQAVA